MFHRRHSLSSNSVIRKLTHDSMLGKKFLAYVLVTVLLVVTNYLTKDLKEGSTDLTDGLRIVCITVRKPWQREYEDDSYFASAIWK